MMTQNDCMPLYSGTTTFSVVGAEGEYIRCLGHLSVSERVARLAHIGSDEVSDEIYKVRPELVVIDGVTYEVPAYFPDKNTGKPVFLLPLSEKKLERIATHRFKPPRQMTLGECERE